MNAFYLQKEAEVYDDPHFKHGLPLIVITSLKSGSRRFLTKRKYSRLAMAYQDDPPNSQPFKKASSNSRMI